MSQKYIYLIKEYQGYTDTHLNKVCDLVAPILEQLKIYSQLYRSDLVHLLVPKVTKDIALIIADYSDYPEKKMIAYRDVNADSNNKIYMADHKFKAILKIFDETPDLFIELLIEHTSNKFDTIDNLVQKIIHDLDLYTLHVMDKIVYIS